LKTETVEFERDPHFFRDASDRPTHDRADIDSLSYADVGRRIANRFALKQSSELVVGLDAMFWDFTDGQVIIELAWDNWMCFMVTAKKPDAEPLVHKVASFLSDELPARIDL
jgi:hypothetical protein